MKKRINAPSFQFICVFLQSPIESLTILLDIFSDMKKLLFLLTLTLTLSANAQRQFEFVNSSDGESMVYAFLPEASKATGRAIVDCPGGGYGMVCMDYEGTDWAPYFNDMGIAYFVLKYRMPKGDRRIPIGDAENAIKTVRDSAAVWNINPYDVGIMGFSAGGHLASTIATHADFYARPNFQILFYPVITMEERYTHRGSKTNFLGQDYDNERIRRDYSNETQVKRHITPPAILFMSDDDRVVPPIGNGVTYYTALRQNDVSASLHLYPEAGHGWGYKPSFAYHDAMLQALSTWLSRLKAPKQESVRVACVGNSITDGSGIDLSDTYGYPATLQRLLGESYYVRNFGRGARTMLNKGDHPYMNEFAWQDCKQFKPQVVVIKLGTNDSKTDNWQHGDEFEADMQQMIDELKALDSQPRIFLAYPIKAWKDTWTINDSVITNAIIPTIDRLVQKNQLEVIDLHTPFSAPEAEALMQRDGIHPRAEGARKMAEIISESIKSEPKVVKKSKKATKKAKTKRK